MAILLGMAAYTYWMIDATAAVVLALEAVMLALFAFAAFRRPSGEVSR